MADKQITVVAKLKARKDILEQVKDRLLALVEPTRNEQGCISYDLHQSAEEPAEFLFYEQWTDRAALDRHLEKPQLKDLVAKADELLEEPIEMSIWRKIS